MENIITRSSQKIYYLYNNLKISNTYIENSICIHNMQSKESSILFDFVESLLSKLPDKNIESLSEAIDKFTEQTDSCEKLIDSINDKLRKPFINRIEKFEELKYLNSNKISEDSLEFAFNELNQSIQKIYKDGNSQMYKEIVNFFFNLIDIFSIKKVFAKGNLLLFGADMLFKVSKTLGNILEWVDSKYSYAILSSIIKLLTQDIAPIITLFENYTLHNTFIIDDKILIDFSGFNTQVDELKTIFKQNLGVCLQLEKPLAQDFGNNANLVFHGKKANDTISIYGKGKICEFLKNQMSVSSNRFAYIESPFFNSTEFVKLIKDIEGQSKKETDTSKQGFNYLIISNAPYKHNAGLSTALIGRLNNKISYDNQSYKKITNDILHPKPDKDYNAVVDYSKYKITIDATTKEAYVLSLSPFVHIDKEQYKEYKTLYDDYIQIQIKAPGKMGELRDGQYLSFVYDEYKMQKVASYAYIQSFFKQPKDKQEIVEK